MKYCTNCGSKLKENTNFCTKCGKPTSLQIEKMKNENKRKRHENNDKLILELGIILIIISSIIFFIIKYNDMSNITRIVFLVAETLIFMLVSYTTKKLKLNSYKLFYFVGILFLPAIMILLPYYNLLVSFFREGAGLSIYLSICSFILIIICLISKKVLESSIYLYLSSLLTNVLFITILCSFNYGLPCNLFFTLLLIVNLILSIICVRFNANSISKIYLNYLHIFFAASLVYIIYIFNIKINQPLFMFTNLIYILFGYVLLIKNKNNFISIIIQIMISIISICFINKIFSDYSNMKVYISVLVVILELFIVYLLNKGILKFITLFITLFISVYEYASACSHSFIVAFIISIILLLTELFILKIEKNEGNKNFIVVLITLTIYALIYSITNIFVKIDLAYSLLITSIICSIIYSILKINKDSKSTIFEWFSYVFLLYASFYISNTSQVVQAILTEGLWIYYFIFKFIFDDEKVLRYLLFAGSIINLLLLADIFNFSLYYVLLLISFIFILISTIAKHKNINMNVIYIIGVTLLGLETLFKIEQYNIISILLHLIIYIFVYLNSFYKKDIHYIFKLLYMIGFFSLISKIILHFTLPSLITNIILLFVFVVLLITLFLLEADDDKHILTYSLFLIYPIKNIISIIDVLNAYNTLIMCGVLTIYVFVLTEVILNKKDKKLLIELIWIILVSSANLNFTDISNVMFLILLSIFLIIFGIAKDQDTFIYYGSIVLLICALSQLIKFDSSILIIITLLIIGVGLIVYSLMKERKRNKNNKI